MSSTTSPARRAAVVAACALLLAACTGPADKADPAPSGPTSATTDGSTTATTVGPVTALFDGLYDASTDAAETARQEQREALVAACMVDKGWEYTPRMVVQPERASEADAPTGPQGKEYAEQYGYGMIDGPEPPSSEPSAAPHPNDVFVATLSETEKATYEKDLWGYTSQDEVASEDDEATDDDEAAASCTGKADAQVGDSFAAMEAVYDDPQHAELLSSLERIWTDADQAPSVLEAKADWASCMADAGIDDAPDPDALYVALLDQLGGLNGDGDGEPDPSVVAEFKKQEIRTAVADHECRASAAYEEKRAKASLDAETSFYESHRDALEGLADALRTAMESGKK